VLAAQLALLRLARNRIATRNCATGCGNRGASVKQIFPLLVAGVFVSACCASSSGPSGSRR